MLLPERFFDVADEREQSGEKARSAINRTYDLNNEGRFIDGIEAVKQAVYKVLKTSRFRYPIYSSDYGLELDDLFGADSDYVCVELERRIIEALSVDSRIVGVSGFAFDQVRATGSGSVVLVSFVVNTADAEFMVSENINVGGGDSYVQQYDI
jgi:hypothetical protein